jgi:uncharacterized membrane protein
MKLNLKKEILFLLISAIPFVYLGFIYADLPETVPTHFDLNGVANGWSSRMSLWFIPGCLTIGFDLLMLFLPMIDPKRRLSSGSGKFEHIRFVVVLFIAALSLMILYTAKNEHINHLNKFLFAFTGLFFAALGNFFPSLKPNYFIGIRSPWALENETVWKKTHQMAGKLWVAGGILLIILAFAIPSNGFLGKVALPLLLVISVFPILYSYFIWRKIKKEDTVKTSL